MATLRVKVPNYVASPKRPRKMVIQTEDRKIIFTVPFAPQEVQYSGLGWGWNSVPRPGGRQALMLRGAQDTPTLSFNLIMAYGQPRNGFIGERVDQTNRLKVLQRLAKSGKRLDIVFGGFFDDGLWRMTAVP